jgi:ribosomal protein S18 acetylase RimI-like enzyme
MVDVRPAEWLADSPGVVDLQEMLSLPAIQANTRLWQNAVGQLVAFALVDDYNNLHFEIAPQAAGQEIEAQIVAWGIECIRKSSQGSPATLDASCREDNAERIAFLERHGFEQQAIHTIHMIRPLAQPIAAPQLPEGFSIRCVTGESEAQALVALHRAAHGTDHFTLKDRLAWMHTPEYDPELDLVAVAPDGALAAYCFCQISQQENARTGRNEGYTDPVATHPNFQRRGLARALLLTGLHLLKQKGAQFAALGTSSENIAMQHTATSVGFGVQSTRLWFARLV